VQDQVAEYEPPEDDPPRDTRVKLVHKTVRTYLDRKGWAQLSPSTFSPEAIWLNVCVEVILGNTQTARCVSRYQRQRQILRNQPHTKSRGMRGHEPEKSADCNGKIGISMPSSPSILLHNAVSEIFYYARCLEQNRNLSSFPYISRVLCPEMMTSHASQVGGCSICWDANALLKIDSTLAFAALHGLRLYLQDVIARFGQQPDPDLGVRRSPHLPTSANVGEEVVVEHRARRGILYGAIRFATWHRESLQSEPGVDDHDVKLVRSVLEIDASIHDSDLIHAIQGSSTEVVETLANHLPPDQTTLSYHGCVESSEVRFDPDLPVGLLWVVAREAICDIPEKLDLFLDLGEEVDACWGENGTAMHAAFFREKYPLSFCSSNLSPSDYMFKVKRILLSKGSTVKRDLSFWKAVKMIPQNSSD
jgi:hypothetical protein